MLSVYSHLSSVNGEFGSDVIKIVPLIYSVYSWLIM